ncbi:MAG: cation:proton antiporter [Bacteroidaceae bacterium]|nr:cation:proton antiporter [Bacteroidaceae bacterium]
MEGLPGLVVDLALILSAAGVVTLLFKRLKQPLVLGYIVAGIIVSPHTYGESVTDVADISVWANIGVIFLLFALGLEFSFKKIVKSGIGPVIAACTIITCMIAFGAFVGHMFGWKHTDCLYLGGMLAMSSTTIIYKAFEDLGLRHQRFAGLVLSVLILEDILAIVLMVALSTLSASRNFEGMDLIWNVCELAFFIVLWFVVGIFIVPRFLKNTRNIMSRETLLVVSLALCLLMVLLANKLGFSAAFGAFMMGSILAETVEADTIVKVVAPVKDLFGAIFFVSVGMLVDPHIIAQYIVPIVAITLAILVGQSVFGTLGYLMSGQPLKVAMQSGFSMAQIGEFAFIIAASGMALGVTSDFLYPIVVAVSVITTFLTPYMIKAAPPAYDRIDRLMPRSWKRFLNRYQGDGTEHSVSRKRDTMWRRYLISLGKMTGVYFVLSVAVVVMAENLLFPLLKTTSLPLSWSRAIVCLTAIVCLSPFLRAIVMKKNHSEEFKVLWNANHFNRFPLVFTIFVRVVIAIAFLFKIISDYYTASDSAIVTLAVVLIAAMAYSKRLKRNSIEMERSFVQNLRSRDLRAELMGQRRPLYAGKLLARDLHFADYEIPADSSWAGNSIGHLRLGNKYRIHICSILRGGIQRINIPGPKEIIFPGDIIQVIGSDDQLNKFAEEVDNNRITPEPDFEEREMKLRKLEIDENSPFLGVSIKDSGLRGRYNCMVVGLESGVSSLVIPNIDRPLEVGDVLWLVGEEKSLAMLEQ